jgi:hypothetical protein
MKRISDRYEMKARIRILHGILEKKIGLRNIAPLLVLLILNAQMAELVDAPDSKSGIGNNVQVRFLFWALHPSLEGFFML